jgi:DnaJ-class molecular chaperone
MPKTTCDRCRGTGETFTLSGNCACESCCGRGFFGEDDALVARREAERKDAEKQVLDAARAAIARFAGKDIATKAVRVLKRQRLLVSKIPA